MNDRIVLLPEELLKQIQNEASAAYPEECCGILIGDANGTEKKVSRLYVTQNVHSENKERRFKISPDDFKQAEKIAREQNAEIIGFYHSHPDHPAEPSEHDREYAWPWYLYLIVSVNEGQYAAMRGWELRDDREKYDEVTVTIS